MILHLGYCLPLDALRCSRDLCVLGVFFMKQTVCITAALMVLTATTAPALATSSNSADKNKALKKGSPMKSISQTISINATSEAVYKAITTQDSVRSWW